MGPTESLTDTTARRRGRPSGYYPEVCDDIIAYMASGASLISFASGMGVSSRTLYRWAKANPEFAECIELAQERAFVYWEAVGMDHLTQAADQPKLNTTVWTYFMHRRFNRLLDSDHAHMTALIADLDAIDNPVPSAPASSPATAMTATEEKVSTMQPLDFARMMSKGTEIPEKDVHGPPPSVIDQYEVWRAKQPNATWLRLDDDIYEAAGREIPLLPRYDHITVDPYAVDDDPDRPKKPSEIEPIPERTIDSHYFGISDDMDEATQELTRAYHRHYLKDKINPCLILMPDGKVLYCS